MKNSTYKSYPKGTLILVRDLRPKVHKKLKPLYYKAPQKIITEYKCTVYAMDFLGKVRKHSKNNIKIVSNRSNFLFWPAPLWLVSTVDMMCVCLLLFHKPDALMQH